MLPDFSQYSEVALMFLVVMAFIRLIERLLEVHFEFLKPKASLDGVEERIKEAVASGLQVVVKDIDSLSDDVKGVRKEVNRINDSITEHGTRLTKLETEHRFYHHKHGKLQEDN